MTIDEETKIANMLENLEKLKESCLRTHGDAITYKLCKVVEELILYVVSKNT